MQFRYSSSSEMQCCDDLELVSSAGVLECHPYLLGTYRKIGSCGGRSFYQHDNNTDIFLYHACGAWYAGMEVGFSVLTSINDINVENCALCSVLSRDLVSDDLSSKACYAKVRLKIKFFLKEPMEHCVTEGYRKYYTNRANKHD